MYSFARAIAIIHKNNLTCVNVVVVLYFLIRAIFFSYKAFLLHLTKKKKKKKENTTSHTNFQENLNFIISNHKLLYLQLTHLAPKYAISFHPLWGKFPSTVKHWFNKLVHIITLKMGVHINFQPLFQLILSEIAKTLTYEV